MLDGVGYTSLKGALMARGAREIARLIRAMGGNELSAMACAIWVITRRRCFPPIAITGFSVSALSGQALQLSGRRGGNVKALVRLGEIYQVDLPICKTVYCMLYEGHPVDQALPTLFARSVKGEFYI